MKSMFILVITFTFSVYSMHCAIPVLGGRPCPKHRPRVYCFIPPCLNKKCPAYPNAKCVENYCGGCFADFYYYYRKVDCSCNFGCFKIYKPVCGSDGKTYPNACELRRADCKSSRKIYIRHKGTCRSPVCLLPKVIGPCRARFPRYFYNKISGKCELFYYGGCRGNANNFKTKNNCEAKCVIKRGY